MEEREKGQPLARTLNTLTYI